MHISHLWITVYFLFFSNCCVLRKSLWQVPIFIYVLFIPLTSFTHFAGWVGKRLLFTELQNHRVVEVGRDLWRSSVPTPLLKQGHLEPVAQDVSRWLLNISSNETLQPPWATCSDAQSTSQWRSVSWCSDRTSCISICAHVLWSCHWASLKRAWLHPIHIPLSGISIC